MICGERLCEMVGKALDVGEPFSMVEVEVYFIALMKQFNELLALRAIKVGHVHQAAKLREGFVIFIVFSHLYRFLIEWLFMDIRHVDQREGDFPDRKVALSLVFKFLIPLCHDYPSTICSSYQLHLYPGGFPSARGW